MSMADGRSFLFTPANNSHRLGKALLSEADCLVADLEDALPPAQKETGRASLVSFLRRQSIPKTVLVRINGLDSPWCWEDLTAVVAAGAVNVMLPKSEQAVDLAIADWILGQLEQKFHLEPGSVKVAPLIENALGVSNAREIAAAARVERLMFGSLDFAADLGVVPSAGGREMLYARQSLIVASAAARLAPPVDTVWTDLRDENGLAQETLAAKQLGFGGKLAIHPGQVAVINRIFSPTGEEVEWAQKVRQEYRQASQQGSGVIQVDGKMVDAPVISRAERILLAWERSKTDA